MRKILALLAMMALASCGGGGGSNTAPNPNPPAPATTAPQGDLVTPTFTLNLGGKTGTSASRDPKYINATKTKSVKITLISNNGTPTTVTNPSTTTDLNGGAGTTSCPGSCTVPGPPSPPGTDRYSVTTYDTAGATGNILSTATKDFTIVAGSANTGLTIVLFGVVKSVTLSGVPVAPAANTTPTPTALTVQALDAQSGVITGTYGDNSTGAGYINNLALNGTPVTVTVDETDPNGVTLVAGGGATQNSQYSVTLHKDTETVTFTYKGLAENTRTLNATATGATAATPVTFQPTLNAITPSSGTQIDLYVPGDVGGTGASGGQTFTELGFTNSPYNKSFSTTFTITNTYSTACSHIATFTQSTPGVLAVTAATTAATPTAGSCDLTVNDGLTQGGHTSTATVVVTYTTSSVGASSKHRKQ